MMVHEVFMIVFMNRNVHLFVSFFPYFRFYLEISSVDALLLD